MALVQQSDARTRYFFIHVMKVGGYSLVDMVARDHFPDIRQRFPNRDDGAATQYSRLKKAIEERGSEIRFYGGHYPYAALQHLGPDVRTMALFRDPVERAISHIRHFKSLPLYKNRTPEQMYSDRHSFECWFNNLQLRMFAVRSIEEGKSVFEPTLLTEADLDRALDNVRNVDVIGLTSEFEDFIAILRLQFGWHFSRISRINKSLPFKISSELRERIAADLELDMHFYEGVRKIYVERREALIAKHGALLGVANS